jgi:DNA-binding response OmpR family regulator
MNHSFAMKTHSLTYPETRRVLVADDSPTVLHVLKSVLEDAGYTVVAARDGREAFRILGADSDFIAAVFDVEMPHLTGPDLTRHMQTEKRLMRIPVIVMTNAHDPRTHFVSLSAGAAVFLPKPFTAHQLRLMIKIVERRRHGRLPQQASEVGGA